MDDRGACQWLLAIQVNRKLGCTKNFPSGKCCLENEEGGKQPDLCSVYGVLGFFLLSA